MTKLTNEELLDKFEANSRQLQHVIHDSQQKGETEILRHHLRALILKRMAEGAAGEVAPRNVEWIDWLLGYFDDKAINEGQQKIIVRELKNLKRGSASTAGPRSIQGPVCPKCYTREVTVEYAVSDEITSHTVGNCRKCGFQEDWQLFFAAAPAEDAKGRNECPNSAFSS